MRRFVHFVLAVFLFGFAATDDPCSNPKLLSGERRISGYVIQPEDSPFCDRRLEKGWYSTGENILAHSPVEKCGTLLVWYIRDELPKKENETVNITMCLKTLSNRCLKTKVIQVINCGDKVVYYLEPTLGCPEGYCLEPKTADAGGHQDIVPTLHIKPVINVGLLKANGRQQIHFFCDLDPGQVSNDIAYQVQWYLGKHVLGTLLSTSNYVRYTRQDEFRSRTSLNEDDMMQTGNKRLGIDLKCSVTARTVSTRTIGVFVSDSFFAGIEIMNKTEIQLKETETKTIFIRLTVPFTCNMDIADEYCTLDINVIIPDDDNCYIHGLRVKNEDLKGCGVQFKQKSWNEPKGFTISAKSGAVQYNSGKHFVIQLSTQLEVIGHEIFQNYAVKDTIRVYVSSEVQKLQGLACRAVCDPHMTTFDGLSYENHDKATYILYRHKDLPAEVQMKTSECFGSGNNGHPYCPCGIAVRAGRDIFVADLCDGNREIRTRICKDGVLRGKIDRNGNEFTIYFPTGTRVDISQYGVFFNVYIYPSVSDIGNSEGLCGYLDFSTKKDLVKRNGLNVLDSLTPHEFNNDWKLLTSVDFDLFDEHNDDKLPTWQETNYLCDCKETNAGINSNISCSPELIKKCTFSTNHFQSEYCGLDVKKRHIHNEIQRFTTDPFEENLLMFKRSAEKSTITFDEKSARSACWKYLNASVVFQKCSMLRTLNLTAYVENCVADAMMTNSMDWAPVHLDGVQDHCVYHLEKNKPLPKEVLKYIIPLNNTTGSTNAANNTLSWGQNISVAALLEEVKSMSCPFACNRLGRCVNGACLCDHGYGSSDCSVNVNTPPHVKGITNKGVCDMKTMPCEKAAVLGTSFAESHELSCKLTPFQVRDGEERLFLGQPVLTKADFFTSVMIYCPLPEKRPSRSVQVSYVNTIMASGYLVSVSNNGLVFGSNFTFLMLDSTCIDCTKAGQEIKCVVKDGFCSSDGKCYADGEKNGCKICKADIPSSMRWIDGTDCFKTPAIIIEESFKPWIIGVILGICVVVVMLIVGVICLYKKKRYKNKLGASMDWINANAYVPTTPVSNAHFQPKQLKVTR